MITALVLLAWIAAGILNAGMMGGWRYYDLYPRYPELGTPDEIWENDGIDYLMWGIALSGGFIGLVISPFLCGVKFKY